MSAIDLYSGIGGWTLGLRMAGEDIINSYEWWDEANKTHNINHGYDHPEIDIRSMVDKNGVIRPDLLPQPNTLDFVVGSPPCTQFSFANRGGSGDISEGLIDIYAFLRIVEYLNPRFWAMENVPRVATILKNEVFSEKGTLKSFQGLFNNDPCCIQVYDASKFGVPQRRKRMIAGNFNHKLLLSYTKLSDTITLGDIITSLSGNKILDLIYDITLSKDQLTDNVEEEVLSPEEERINRESKQYHPVYNKMSFPENSKLPSRTVTALCTRVSRESIIIKNDHGFRRLTVRERASLQSFPITYQFYANSYGSKLKMIGNAIPPLMAYYIACAMKGMQEPKPPKDLTFKHSIPKQLPVIHIPPINGQHFKKDRKFRAAIKNLRFGSGMRFDLMNFKNKSIDEMKWTVKFYYGNSKKIKNTNLDTHLLNEMMDYLSNYDLTLTDVLEEYKKQLRSINFNNIQLNWIRSTTDGLHPFQLCDIIGEYSEKLEEKIKIIGNQIDGFEKEFLDIDSKKLRDHRLKIMSGFILGSIFNEIAQNQSSLN